MAISITRILGRSLKWLFYLILLTLIIAFVFLATLDLNRYKDQLTTLLNQQTGLEFSIGKIDWTIWHPGLASIEQFQVALEGEPLLEFEQLFLALGALDPIRRRVDIDQIYLKGLNSELSQSRIDRALDTVKKHRPPAPEQTEPAKDTDESLPLSHVELKDIEINVDNFAWLQDDVTYRTQELKLQVFDWAIIENSVLDPLQWDFQLDLLLNQANHPELALKDLEIDFAMKGDRIHLQELSAQLLGGKLVTSAEILLADEPEVRIQKLLLDGLDVEIASHWLPEPASQENLPEDEAPDALVTVETTDIEEVTETTITLGSDEKAPTEITVTADADTTEPQVNVDSLQQDGQTSTQVTVTTEDTEAPAQVEIASRDSADQVMVEKSQDQQETVVTVSNPESDVEPEVRMQTSTSEQEVVQSTPARQALHHLSIEQLVVRNLNLSSPHEQLPLTLTAFDLKLDSLVLIDQGRLLAYPLPFPQDSRLQVTMNEGVYGDFTIGQLQLMTRLTQKQLAIELLKGQTFEGQFATLANIDLNEKPDIQVRLLELTDIELPIYQKWMGDPQSEETKATSESEPAAASSEQTAKALPINMLVLEEVQLNNLSVLSEAEQLPLSIQGLNLYAKNLPVIETGQLSQIPPDWSTPASFDITLQEGLYQGYWVRQLDLAGQLGADGLQLERMNGQVPGGDLKSSGKVDFSTDDWPTELKLNVDHIDIGKISEQLKDNPFPFSGEVTVDLDIKSRGKDKDTFLKYLTGQTSVRSNGIAVQNLNLDLILQQYLSSQKTGLMDVAGYVALGPAGALVSQVGTLGSSLAGVGSGKTKFGQVDLRANFTNGVADLNDSALATHQYLLAFRGKVDVPNEKFQKLETGIINDQGCAELIRSVNGTFSKPEVELASTMFGTVLTPLNTLLDLAEDTADTVSGEGCDVFYSGPVKYPPGGKKGVLSVLPDVPVISDEE